ncbi:RING-type E3 ubiquitin transferase [Psidium guajava]|nr:RING-type E3 ubiquitin transferase [Psidium guajava]
MVVADRLIDGRTITADPLSRGLPRSQDHGLTAVGSGCDMCERAQATVICCADEAALCAKCVVELHTTNKLASKH